jgi:prephenate dehydrogenase
MTIQISIIGLGQIGASVGLALKEKKDMLQRIGNDIEVNVGRQAEKIGAIDRHEVNLLRLIKDADLVVLSLPLNQMRETLELIAPGLRENCVVMDTGSAKEAVAAWAAELLPQGRHYIGLTPVLNPAYLHEVDLGINAARPDLFQGGLMAIVAPPQADSAAIKLAADMTRLLGALPLFADPLEVDGLMAATHLLPQLMASGLLNATVDQPGWREGRKFAGRAYAEATAPAILPGDAKSLSVTALLNRENTLRVLDSAIAALSAIRNDIDRNDEASLDERLSRARKGRETWWKGRQSMEWVSESAPGVKMPEMPSMFSRLFGTGGKMPKDRK